MACPTSPYDASPRFKGKSARGLYGPLDSLRDDVAYEDFPGYRLDRRMLHLLQLH